MWVLVSPRSLGSKTVQLKVQFAGNISAFHVTVCFDNFAFAF